MPEIDAGGARERHGLMGVPPPGRLRWNRPERRFTCRQFQAKDRTIDSFADAAIGRSAPIAKSDEQVR
jgi:hypothetical protein